MVEASLLGDPVSGHGGDRVVFGELVVWGVILHTDGHFAVVAVEVELVSSS